MATVAPAYKGACPSCSFPVVLVAYDETRAEPLPPGGGREIPAHVTCPRCLGDICLPENGQLAPGCLFDYGEGSILSDGGDWSAE